jgi:hypothetical protein
MLPKRLPPHMIREDVVMADDEPETYVQCPRCRGQGILMLVQDDRSHVQDCPCCGPYRRGDAHGLVPKSVAARYGL